MTIRRYIEWSGFGRMYHRYYGPARTMIDMHTREVLEEWFLDGERIK